jgi:hypothetical protein
MLFSDITKPALWSTDTLNLARKECRAKLANTKTQEATRVEVTGLLTEIDRVLRHRSKPTRP